MYKVNENIRIRNFDDFFLLIDITTNYVYKINNNTFKYLSKLLNNKVFSNKDKIFLLKLLNQGIIKEYNQ